VTLQDKSVIVLDGDIVSGEDHINWHHTVVQWIEEVGLPAVGQCGHGMWQVAVQGDQDQLHVLIAALCPMGCES